MSFVMWLLCHLPCDWRHHLPRGPTRERNVEQPECDTWTKQSATREQTWVRHVEHSDRDTWTNRSATRGAVSKSHDHIHVSMCLATSAASMGRATWHPLPWPISWPFGLVIEQIHFYDEKRVGHGKVPLLWPKWPIGHGRPNVMDLLWPIQFGHKLVIKKCSVTKFACTVTKPFGHWCWVLY
jgi:hypothetical protein